jgi:hypothetical protein
MNQTQKTRLRCHCWKNLLAVALLAGFSSTSLALDVVTGQVRNQTRLQASTGDEVILLRVATEEQQKMVEEARTRSGADGFFSFPLPPGAPATHDKRTYLVRVVHQGVNYDAVLNPSSTQKGAKLNVDVFDASTLVSHIAGTIEIIRAGTIGKMLHVSDMVEIQNQSSPPVTQSGERSFDVYVPPQAKITSVLAAGPGNAAAMIATTPAPGDSGHYFVNFPLRPGATKFAFNYDVPYDGKANFQTRHSYSLQELAVMIPPTMKFSSPSIGFKTLPTGNENYRVQAIGKLNAGPGPEFLISGIGLLPSIRGIDGAEAHAAPVEPAVPVLKVPPPASASLQAASAQSSKTPGVSSAPQPRSPNSLPWILGILGLLLISTSAAAIRGARSPRRSASQLRVVGMKGKHGPAFLLDALKEELFQLEAARVRGTISFEEYNQSRSALEETVKRALLRAG